LYVFARTLESVAAVFDVVVTAMKITHAQTSISVTFNSIIAAAIYNIVTIMEIVTAALSIMVVTFQIGPRKARNTLNKETSSICGHSRRFAG
jgi:hypothetical protein